MDDIDDDEEEGRKEGRKGGREGSRTHEIQRHLLKLPPSASQWLQSNM